MSSELDKARAALAYFSGPRCRVNLHAEYECSQHIVCTRPAGHAPPCHVGHSADEYTGHLRAALAEVDRLTAALAEAEATIANERGEGDPPEPGWMFSDDPNDPYGAMYVPDSTGRRWAHQRASAWEQRIGGTIRWIWLTAEMDSGWASTARAAMRAATLKETP